MVSEMLRSRYVVLAALVVLAYYLFRALVNSVRSPEGPVACPKCGSTIVSVVCEDFHQYDSLGRLVDWGKALKHPRAKCWACGHTAEAVRFGVSREMPVRRAVVWSRYRSRNFGMAQFRSPYRCPECSSRAVKLAWEIREDWAQGEIYGWTHTMQKGDPGIDRVIGACLACGFTGPSGSFTPDGLPANIAADEVFHNNGGISPDLIRKYWPEHAEVLCDRLGYKTDSIKAAEAA